MSQTSRTMVRQFIFTLFYKSFCIYLSPSLLLIFLPVVTLVCSLPPSLSAVACGHSTLRLYNGYVSDFTLSTLDWCGKLSDYEPLQLEHVTSTNRTLVRFVTDSRPRQMGQNGHRGFKLMWMAVTVGGEWSRQDGRHDVG